MKRVKIHIERLTVTGFDHVDRGALQAHIEREVARVVEERTPQRSSTLDRVDGGEVTLPRAPTASQLGRAVSAAVGNTLHKVNKP